MTDMINLARVCIPSPEYNTGKEVFNTIQRGSLDGVLFELLDNAPNNDDLSRYREFYEIVDGVYNMSCVVSPLPLKRPFVQWYQMNDFGKSVASGGKDKQNRYVVVQSAVLVCHTMEEYRFLSHIYLNFLNSLNGRPLVACSQKVPARFDADLKNERVRALVQKWAGPQAKQR